MVEREISEGGDPHDWFSGKGLVPDPTPPEELKEEARIVLRDLNSVLRRLYDMEEHHYYATKLEELIDMMERDIGERT